MSKTIKSIVKKGLSNFNLIIRSKVNGKYFKIPILGNVGISNLSISEQWMVDLLKALLSIDANKFVDVGVNIGQTLLKVKSVDAQIEYLGFEPNPSCVFYVNKLIKVNSIKNTALYPVGISTKTELGVFNFYYDSETDGSASIIKDNNNKTVNRKEFIPLFDINTLKTKVDFDNMSILKIDVEGAELEVIKSFEDEIKRNNPFIITEILPVYNEEENPVRFQRQNNLLEALHTLDYFTFRIIKEKKNLIAIKKIQSIEIHSDLNKCEYLFVPKSKLQKLASSGLTLT
ncbi:FkbM family methyltransferase [Aequorivita viscosa]|nr:FkbM family methyltransferase [Aequorivita viscosa]